MSLICLTSSDPPFASMENEGFRGIVVRSDDGREAVMENVLLYAHMDEPQAAAAVAAPQPAAAKNDTAPAIDLNELAEMDSFLDGLDL